MEENYWLGRVDEITAQMISEETMATRNNTALAVTGQKTTEKGKTVFVLPAPARAPPPPGAWREAVTHLCSTAPFFPAGRPHDSYVEKIGSRESFQLSSICGAWRSRLPSAAAPSNILLPSPQSPVWWFLFCFLFFQVCTLTQEINEKCHKTSNKSFQWKLEIKINCQRNLWTKEGGKTYN